MKACILTFHSANNYGALLQAYALQSFLEMNAIDVKILNYYSEDISRSYKFPLFSDFFHNTKRSLVLTIQHFLFKGKRKKCNSFRKQYLCLTKEYDKTNIALANDEADIFIVGSDQVWNYQIINQDDVFFLSFVKNKITCSYAASFGVDSIPNKFEDFYKNHLSKIKFISVRENSGVTLCKKIIDREVEQLPDPVFLLPKSMWETVQKKPKSVKPYILVYKITKADKLLTFAKILSKKTGLQIIYVPNDLKDGIIGSLNLSVGPEEWLGYIKNAEYVITNSFHGTVFSIIFKKKFFVEVANNSNKTGSRLYSLLELFDLQNRLISDNTLIDITDYNQTYDSEIENLVIKSKLFIEKIKKEM